MRRLALAVLLCIVPLAGAAQEDASASDRDRDFLTAFLEDNLSSVGRTVRIDGFSGALSARATFDELTIADAEGIWLTIRDGAISWNRSALLSGRVEIDELSAAEIELPRRPGGGAAAEASGFSLPELPVAVDIGKLLAGRVVLGEPLFGAQAVVRLEGNMRLEGGEGAAALSIRRIDGPRGTLTFSGDYANATRKATLDLLVSEGADGIAANLLGLPGKPAIELAVHGSGAIDDFQTDIALSTDGAPRLAGKITFLTAGTSSDGTPERHFSAIIGGDVSPLLLPEYRDFVGTAARLEAEGRRLPSGQIDLTRLILSSRGLDLSGRLILAPEGVPLQAALTARLGLAGSGEVLLPFPGPRTYVRAGDLRLRYDHRKSDGWVLGGTLYGYHRPSVAIASVSLDGSGRITRRGGQGYARARVGGSVRFNATGVAPAEPGLAAAIGPELSGRAVFSWQEGDPLRLPVFDVAGQGYGAQGSATLTAADGGTTLAGRIEAAVLDMSRFSLLAGRSLGGAGRVEVSGSGGILSGLFDLTGSITGRDLSVDQPEIDSLLAGESRVIASARRDRTGIEIRQLDLMATTLSASAKGHLATGSNDLAMTLDFADLSALGGRYRGALKGNATLTGRDGARRITLDATGLNIGVNRPTLDRLLAGPAGLNVGIAERDGKFGLEFFRLTNSQLSIEAAGDVGDGGRRVEVSARLADMALIAPGFPGPLTASGTIRDADGGYAVDLSGQGPGATEAQVAGTVASDFASADLTLTGGGQSSIINPLIAPRNVEGPVRFDLRLSGPPRLSSLHGRVTLESGRLVAPTFGIDFDALRLSADLADGQAVLAGSSSVRGGGDVDLAGPVSLSPPYQANLLFRLSAASLRDPELFATTISGRVQVAGPLLGGAGIAGAVALGPTEVRVPSTGLGTDPVLRDIAHVNEPAAVRGTRIRAGLDGTGAKALGPRPSYGVDLTITAPERIFVRGRGLDAEMGGTLQLSGTTDNIVPSGRFTLIRGRLDLLGKRFTIDEGLIELQGALTPYIRFAAMTEADDVTATILIEGEASAPEIHFRSSPELPEEEVISRLLFGRGLSTLSPLQAAQLASAVAELAGKGGEGVVSRLRRTFGLDDLDVTTSEDGTAALRVGKYLSEKVYTDVTVGSEGTTEIQLNLNVRPGVTARGTLGSDGSTGVGIYFERDY